MPLEYSVSSPTGWLLVVVGVWEGGEGDTDPSVSVSDASVRF
jgi:hypothetical protein